MKLKVLIVAIALAPVFLMAYKVQVGDTLSIDIYLQMGELISKTVIVDSDGFTSLPYVGYTKVMGKTPKEIQDMIQKVLGKILPSSVVAVYVEKKHPEWVYFHGLINGAYDISTLEKGQRRLSAVLALVQSEKGLSEISPESIHIIRNGKVINVDFFKYLEEGNEKYDPELQSGDVVFIPKPMYVGVFGNWGAVKSGMYRIDDGTTLMKVLAEAGVSMNPDVIKEIRLFRKNKIYDFQISDLGELSSFHLENGDMIYVVSYKKIEIYLVGDLSRKLILSERDHPTLRKVLSDSGVTFEGSVRWEIKILRENEVKSYIARSPQDIPQKPLKDMDIIVIRRLPEYVYMHGAITGRFDLSSLNERDRRLSVVLSMVGGKESRINPENISIIRDGRKIKVDYWRYLETGDEKYDPILKGGDVIYTSLPRRVLIYGDGVSQGYRYIREGETLFDVLVESNVSFDPRITKLIVLSRDGKDMMFNVDDTLDMKKTVLKDGDVIRVERFKKIEIYVMGDVSRKITAYESDDITLRKLPALLNLSISDGAKIDFRLVRKGKIYEYVIRDFSELPDIPMKDGDTVYISTVNPVKVYLNGERSGVITFSGFEKADLRTLVYKVGLNDDKSMIFLSRPGTVLTFDVEDVISGRSNIELKNDDYIYITPYAFGKVYIYTSRGVITAGLKEKEESLRNVLTRYGLLPVSDREIESVKIVRKGKERTIGIDDLINGNSDEDLENGDFVIFVPKHERTVYVTGDVSREVLFRPDEKITKESLLSKLGLSEDRIRYIKGELRDGGVVHIYLKKNIRVYVYSRIMGSRMVFFSYDEDPSMVNFISKLSMMKFGDEKSSYKVRVFRDGKEVYEKDISYRSDLSKLSFEFQDGDFVRIDPEIVTVYVFGNGVRQGRYIMPIGSDLKDLFAKLGGVPSGPGVVRILRGGEEKKLRIDTKDIPNYELNDGDVLMFDEVQESFVYVFGDVMRPGAIFVGSGDENLLKVLSLSGGLNGWESKRNVVIIDKSGKKRTLDLDYDQLLNVKVSGGEIVYVPSRTLNKVYVLGAVRNPTVVPIDKETTLLEAIMRAGGFSKTAVSSRVYVFRGGIKGVVEVYDMSWISGKKMGKNPKLQTGDIVFVPDNPMMSINEMISLITPMMNFIDSSIRLYNNVSSIMGK